MLAIWLQSYIRSFVQTISLLVLMDKTADLGSAGATIAGGDDFTGTAIASDAVLLASTLSVDVADVAAATGVTEIAAAINSAAGEVFASVTVTIEDIRRDYGETRYISIGLLDLRAVILVWTPRGKARRVISMRYANDREKEKYSKYLD